MTGGGRLERRPFGVPAKPLKSLIEGRVISRVDLEGDKKFDFWRVRIEGARPFEGENGCLEDQIGQEVLIMVRQNRQIPEGGILDDFIVESRGGDERNQAGRKLYLGEKLSEKLKLQSR